MEGFSLLPKDLNFFLFFFYEWTGEISAKRSDYDSAKTHNFVPENAQRWEPRVI